MKAFIILFLLTANSLGAFCQGFVAGDIVVGALGFPPKGGFEINTFTQEPRPKIIVDWGDGIVDTVAGPSFLISQDLYQNIYQKNHYYQDTGYYTITYSDNYWIEGIANFDNSGTQPFVLEADIWLTQYLNYSQNHSIYFSAPADYIYYDNGVVTHELVPADLDSDSVSQKLIPVPVLGYFWPDATDSLVCCLIWDKPTQAGKYAFGFEVTDWRNGIRMSSVQRFITVQVDTVFSKDVENKKIDRGLVVNPNPTDTGLKVFFKGPFVLNNDYNLSISDQLGRKLFQKPVNFMEYTGGLSIDVSAWPPGLYLVTLEADGRVWMEKLIVQ